MMKKYFLFGMALLGFSVAGCASNPLTEGAYVGSNTCAPSPGMNTPPPQAATTVPLFASSEVKADARNRAAMERRTGRPVVARPVSVDDLIGWHQAGVEEIYVITHIRTHGAYRPLTPQEVLTLQQRGISNNIIRSMQEHPYAKVSAPTPPPSNVRSSTRTYAKAPPTNDTYNRPLEHCDNCTTARPVVGNSGKVRVRSSPGACSDGCYYIGEPILISDSIWVGDGCMRCQEGGY
ncbi:MAG: hypothetical protein Q4D62_03275 [Planctomycetia bacterium]|nr:hypothetical protein [Planctomycetia bacterium]